MFCFFRKKLSVDSFIFSTWLGGGNLAREMTRSFRGQGGIFKMSLGKSPMRIPRHYQDDMIFVRSGIPTKNFHLPLLLEGGTTQDVPRWFWLRNLGDFPPAITQKISRNFRGQDQCGSLTAMAKSSLVGGSTTTASKTYIIYICMNEWYQCWYVYIHIHIHIHIHIYDDYTVCIYHINRFPHPYLHLINMSLFHQYGNTWATYRQMYVYTHYVT